MGHPLRPQHVLKRSRGDGPAGINAVVVVRSASKDREMMGQICKGVVGGIAI